MSTSERLVGQKSSVEALPLPEKALIAAILALFLLLHGLAGIALQGAGGVDRAPSGPDTTLQLYD